MILKKRRFITCAIFAVFYSICQVIGKIFLEDEPTYAHSVSYYISSNLSFAIINLVGAFVIAFILFLLADLIIDAVQKKRRDLQFDDAGFVRLKNRRFRKKYLLIFFLFLLCWVPYLIIFYPGVVTYDATKEVMSALHLPVTPVKNIILDGVTEQYSSVFSLVPVWLFGAFFKLGVTLGNVQTGVLIYIILQFLLFAAVFTWTLNNLENFAAPRPVRWIFFIIYAFFPLITFSTFVMYSDGLFALALLVCAVHITRIVKTNGAYLRLKRKVLWLALSFLAVALIRKTGIYIVLVMCILILLFYRRYFKQALLVFVCLILVFFVGYEGLLYNSLHVNRKGMHENFSIPFQQTARFLRDYPEKIPKEEIDAIDKVLDAKEIPKVYEVSRSDYVKNTFKYEADTEDLKAYIGVWWKQFWNAPRIYLEAYLYNYSRYFQTDNTPSTYGYYTTANIDVAYEKIPDAKNMYHVQKSDYEQYNTSQPESHANARKGVHETLTAIQHIPVLGIFFRVGFFFQLAIILLLYLICRKDYKRILPLCICLLVMAGCLFSPNNGSYRYTLPLFFILPYLCLELFTAAPAPYGKKRRDRKDEMKREY